MGQDHGGQMNCILGINLQPSLSCYRYPSMTVFFEISTWKMACSTVNLKDQEWSSMMKCLIVRLAPEKKDPSRNHKVLRQLRKGQRQINLSLQWWGYFRHYGVAFRAFFCSGQQLVLDTPIHAFLVTWYISKIFMKKFFAGAFIWSGAKCIIGVFNT